MDPRRTFSADEITARLAADLPRWSHRDGAIRRTYATAGWKASLMAANAIGHLAEAAWHHPDILVSYPRIEVALSSHDVDGITERDFALAAKIEELLTWRPGADGGALEGVPDDERYAYLRYED